MVMPQPKPRKISRFGGVTGVAAEAKRRKPNDSRTGNAISAVLDRRKWRRVCMGWVGLLRVKLAAGDQRVDELPNREVLFLRLVQHFRDQRFIAEADGAAERILDEGGAETSGE